MRRSVREMATIVLDERDENLQTMKEYADFWKIPYTIGSTARDSILISTNCGIVKQAPSEPTKILAPFGDQGRRRTEEALGVDFVSKSVFLRVPVRPGVGATIHALTYDPKGDRCEPALDVGKTTILWRISGTRTHLLSIDLVSEYRRLLYDGIDDTPSFRFRIVSKLPLSYNTIPRFVRNRVFRSSRESAKNVEDKIGTLEALRAIFLATIVSVATAPIPRLGFWRPGKQYAVALTHDIETRYGFEYGAPQLAKVERQLGFRSTWNMPSERYAIPLGVALDLANNGEVCGHDTLHDGRLALLPPNDQVLRLQRCRLRLESLVSATVRGFRAPLLQHTRNLLAAVAKAGFEFDSSVPSWEPLSPTSLKPHGVPTIFPFWAEGVLEIPVSLPQDHQFLRVLQHTPSETVDRLLELSRWIKELGGACIVLVHPDYEFGRPENEGHYQRLLESFLSDKCDVMTLGEIADWWDTRRDAVINIAGDQISVESANGNSSSNVFELQLVKGFDNDGFKVETIS